MSKDQDQIEEIQEIPQEESSLQQASQQESRDDIPGGAEDVGWEPQEFDKPELFKMKPFQMIDFPSDQQVAGFAMNDHNIVITTYSRKIFRWRFKDDPGCQEMQLQNEGGDFFGNSILKLGENMGKQLGSGLSTMGNAFLDTVSLVTKPLFNANLNSKKKNDLEENKLDKIFLEPKGTHMVVSSDDGESFHAAYIEEGIKQLNQLNGRIIRFLLFNEFTLQQFTNALLITQENKFYNYSLTWNKDKQTHSEVLQKSMFQLPVEKKICDVKRIINKGIITLIISTDQSIYVLSGPKEKDQETYFVKYKDSAEQLRKSELMFKKKSFGSMLIMFQDNILWTDGFQLNYMEVAGQLSINMFEKTKELKYAKKVDCDLERAYKIQEQLYGIGLTKYHYYLLTFDTITILNLITQTVVTHFDLNVKMIGKVQGMVYDRGTQCFWIYCKNGVYRLNTEFEDSEIWKLLIDIKHYKEALVVAEKYDSPYYGHIASLYADALFEERQFEDAAKYYIMSNKSFQEVFLLFSLSNENQTVRALESNFNKKYQFLEYLFFVYFKCQQEHQKQVLLSYILELMVVRKCEDAELKKFLEDHLEELNEDVVEQILQPHGLFSWCIEFAEMKKDVEKVVQHHIANEDLNSVVNKLKQVTEGKQLLELIAKYSYLLMKQLPTTTLEIIKKLPKFDPSILINSLVNVPQNCIDEAVDFMEYCIEKLYISDKVFNNLYLLCLLMPVKQNKIIKFLGNQQKILDDTGHCNFDLMLAQRWFKQHKLLLPSILILSLLGKYEQAIPMALKNNLLSLAKDVALRCEDTARQKQLWIVICGWLLSRGEENVKEVVQLTREIELIQAEDILPYMNESIKLDYFKEEICETLLDYHDQVDKLKNEIRGFYQGCENLKIEYEKMSNRYLFINRKQKCEECFKLLFTEDYIVFGCNHCFHRECLWEYIKKNSDIMDPKRLNRMVDLSIQLTAYETSQSSKKKTNTEEILKKPKMVVEQEFIDLMTVECAVCGSHIIESILQPLDGDEDIEQSWFI